MLHTMPTPVEPGPRSASPETAMLDAARDEFERYGIRRTNMDDIARRAGISRSTLYRRFPNKDALVETLVLRDTTAFFAELDRVAADRDPRSAVVECFTRGVRLTQEMPLVTRILESEPELILGLTNRTDGAPIAQAAAQVATTLRRSGVTMSDGDLHAVAEILVRIAVSLMLNPQGQLDISDQDAVRRYAERYLVRLVW
ncbi:TetR/AcrR family transcriptional regulator [Rhodococcus sp. NPDC058505]|uniref:TetR/AcrR family transcriptional regulator n=1 Tax=unclassified Rhodococcus (in: high G+C Gram-positive bacteria) TaxID=192944 RepID=UPI003668BD49